MIKQLEDIVYVLSDLTHYYRQSPFPNGFGVIYTSTDRSQSQQTQLFEGKYGGIAPKQAFSIFDQMEATAAARENSSYYGTPVGDAYLETVKSGGYPVATPGTSQHEFGLAFDAIANVPANYRSEGQRVLARIAGQLGLHWGGEGDPVHFAMYSRAEWQQVLQQIGVGTLAGIPLGQFGPTWLAKLPPSSYDPNDPNRWQGELGPETGGGLP